MALPAGVTRIPRRSVTKTVQPAFPLTGRHNNLAAGDLANPGNARLANSGQRVRRANLMEGLQDSGDLMVKVLGKDQRGWISMSGTGAWNMTDGNRDSLMPNCLYYFPTGLSAPDFQITTAGMGMIGQGDRVTFVYDGTDAGNVIIRFPATTLLAPTGLFSRINLGASTGHRGTSVTVEYGIQTAGVGLWYLVQWNGTLATNITFA